MMEFQYKNEAVFRAAHAVPWHPILLDVNEWIYGRYGVVVLTSAYRAKKIYPKDSGMHATNPLRADDIRVWVYATPYDLLEKDINDNWQYDPKRPEKKVALIHDTGQGIHGHIQVHPNTVRIT